jgi:5'-nucleotidase
VSKTILVDMDSIVADFYFGVIDRYTQETGHVPPPEILGTWDAKFPNGKDCYAYFKEPGFFEGLKPIPGALEFLEAAKAAGHDVLILSAATLTHVPTEKYKWFTQHLPSFSRQQIMFAARKDLVRGDVLIDDHGKNTGPWLKSHPGGTAIGIEYPYNVVVPDQFTHLVPSYLDFAGAWQKITKLVLG